ncbi:helix-hairpin-helix domain-containing protein [Flavobacteriaceae bacterium]|nr:helix-hairpin-helix domain-containing protein [Flavobacteriaceae bacterium]
MGFYYWFFFTSGYLVLNYYVDFSKESLLDINSKEVIAIQKELDSLRTIEIESKKPKVFPFNPNFLSDFKGYVLGMSTEEIDRLLAFRKENKWINSVKDFKKVTKVSDSLLNKISPYFKFPDWISNSKPKKNYLKKGFKEKTFRQKVDLNITTQEQLEKVNGIGKVNSKNIIDYRNKLGGFSDDIQIYQLYGLDYQVINKVLNEFTVKTPKEIVKMNFNSISASDIATIPGISFDLAKRIWEYRILNEQIESFSQLQNIEGLTKRKLQGIQLYLKIE